MEYVVKNKTFIAPANWMTFLWALRRSRFISCRKDLAAVYHKNHPQFYNNKEPRIPNSIIKSLKKFRDWSIEHDLTPMLYAGTLLGIILTSNLNLYKKKIPNKLNLIAQLNDMFCNTSGKCWNCYLTLNTS